MSISQSKKIVLKLFEKHKNHKTYFVPGLYRGLVLLESLIASKTSMSSSELAKHVGVGRSSVFRLIYTLSYMGYTRNSKYDLSIEVGDRLQRLTKEHLLEEEILSYAENEMIKASNDLPYKINLLMLDLDEITVRRSAAGGGIMPEKDDADRNYSVFEHKIGRAFLADLSVQQLLQLYRSSDHAKPSFDHMLDMVSKYCLMMENLGQHDLETGGRAYYMPVYDASKKPVAIIEFEGGQDLMAEEKMKIPDQLAKLSEAISQAILHKELNT